MGVSGSDFSTIVDWLYGLRLFGAKLGLENVRRLAALAGDPQDRLRFIHVAGTNGKGSTCAMLESVYRHAGWRTGLFTSPHLVSFRERIQVDRGMISEADVVRLAREMAPWLEEFAGDRRPTFFEVVTVLALRYFAEQKCDLIIWETGMGGRLDATNIVQPEASVITNIQLDHEQWLGRTLEEIAGEKAGIIKPGTPVITTAQPGAGLELIRRVARERNAPLRSVSDWRVPIDELTAQLPLESRASPRLSLLGGHQCLNAALALETVEVLRTRFPVSPIQAKQGLESVRWDGRMQLVLTESGQRVLLDGAHNPAGAAALAQSVDSILPGPRALVVGLLADKDGPGMCRLLAPLARRILTTPIDSERSASSESVAELCRQANPEASVSACDSLGQAMRQARDAPALIVTGSLHLVGGALRELGLAALTQPDERRLNEYTLR